MSDDVLWLEKASTATGVYYHDEQTKACFMDFVCVWEFATGYVCRVLAIVCDAADDSL